MHNNLDIKELDFIKGDGLIPAIIQDEETQVVLMLGYMNKETLLESLLLKKVVFFSRTKQKRWLKGETSNNYLHLISITKDCDGDSLLIKVKPDGPACHTGDYSCFKEQTIHNNFLYKLEQIIHNRKQEIKEDSYTHHLFAKGADFVGKKIIEESKEVVLELKENNKINFIAESADLLYHWQVACNLMNVNLNEVISLLEKRNDQNPRK